MFSGWKPLAFPTDFHQNDFCNVKFIAMETRIDSKNKITLNKT